MIQPFRIPFEKIGRWENNESARETAQMSFKSSWEFWKKSAPQSEESDGRSLREGELSVWEYVPEYDYFRVRGNHCEVTLEKRPDYCDRGRVMAKAFSFDIKLHIDFVDCWSPGRCYFNLKYAIEEIESWMRARNQLVVKCNSCEQPTIGRNSLDYPVLDLCEQCGRIVAQETHHTKVL